MSVFFNPPLRVRGARGVTVNTPLLSPLFRGDEKSNPLSFPLTGGEWKEASLTRGMGDYIVWDCFVASLLAMTETESLGYPLSDVGYYNSFVAPAILTLPC